MHKRGQLVTFDFSISFIAFLFILVLFNFVWSQTILQVEDQVSIQLMESDVGMASDILIRTSGFPKNWTNSSFLSIGLANQRNIINSTLFSRMKNVSDFDSVKTALGLGGMDFCVKIIDKNDNHLDNFMECDYSQADFVTPVRRYVLYDFENGTRRTAYFDMVVWK